MRDVNPSRKRATALSMFVVMAALSCADDHDDLGVGASSSSLASSTTGSGGESATTGTGGDEPIEPDGPPRLTVLAGVADRDLSAFCFFGAGPNSRTPFPSGGLAFAASRSLSFPNDEIDTTGEIRVAAILGTVPNGTTCDAVRDDPEASGVEYVELGVLPKGTFDAKRSLLLSTMGCLGGEGHENAQQTLVCGEGYAVDSPTFSVAIFVLSRLVTGSRVSFTGVNASTALDPSDLRIRPGAPNAIDVSVTTSLATGALGPKPPFDLLDRTTLATIPDVGVVVYPPSGSVPTREIKLSEALANSGLAPTDIANGRGYALIALGASPMLGSADWWKPFTFAIIDVDGTP
jgi:hypothetical protein